MKRMLFLFFLSNICYAQRVITIQDELNQFSQFSLLPEYRTNTSLHEISTYDREGKNDDGFSGKFSFVRRNRDSTLVMFETKGPGVINRIWTPTPTEDTLDFFVDDSVFSIRYTDLFSGKVKPFTAPLCGNALGGFYCYYPVLFQDSCKIVSRGKKLQFHQIQWRSYPKGTVVKRKSEKSESTIRSFSTVHHRKIRSGAKSSSTLFQLTNGGRISSFKIYPASAFAGNEKNIWLKITYDEEEQPAVYCPVADFFGFAFGKPSMRSSLLGTSNDTAYCNIPMPFVKNFKFELINDGDEEKEVSLAIISDSSKMKPSSEGKLYTSYNHRRYDKNDGPHVLVNTSGKGHFIGTILQCQGTVPGMTLFFEGDDSTVVDGENTLHGTGSEDYFNGGWYAFPDRWDAAYSLPFHGSLDYNLPYCRTGAYRFYLTDKIPFAKSFYHSIEHGPVNNNIPAIYTSLSFYYEEGPAAKSYVARRVSVYTPDTLNIYPQLTNVNLWNSVGVRSLWAHDTGGMSYVYIVKNETSIRFSLENIDDGEYDLFVDYDKIPAGADIRILQRQNVIKDFFSTYSSDTVRMTMEKIGLIRKNNFLKAFSLEFKVNGVRDQFFLNRFVLVRLPAHAAKQ
jgi:hypothetical protein